VAVVVVIVVLVSGGGSDDNGSTSSGVSSEQTLPPQVVRTSEIEAQGTDSPQRALLEWWQSFQFSDARGVVDRTSQATVDNLGESQLSELVKTRGQGLQGIEVLGATENGDSASIRAGLLTFQPEKQGEPPPDTPTASRPATFTMKKEDGEWRFSVAAFLAPLIEGLRANKKQDQKGQQQEKQQTNTETTPE
jgi:hypothetical protein